MQLPITTWDDKPFSLGDLVYTRLIIDCAEAQLKTVEKLELDQLLDSWALTLKWNEAGQISLKVRYRDVLESSSSQDLKLVLYILKTAEHHETLPVKVNSYKEIRDPKDTSIITEVHMYLTELPLEL